VEEVKKEEEKYLKLVPEEIRWMVSGLSDDRHWALFIALLENEKMTFSQIKEEFGEHPQTLTNRLKDLTQAGLVIKKAKSPEDMTDKKRGFYAPTELGEIMVDSIMQGILSPHKKSCISQKLEYTAVAEPEATYFSNISSSKKIDLNYGFSSSCNKMRKITVKN
jgi:DNA-binding HxlR family transcriptional regulator